MYSDADATTRRAGRDPDTTRGRNTRGGRPGDRLVAGCRVAGPVAGGHRVTTSRHLTERPLGARAVAGHLPRLAGPNRRVARAGRRAGGVPGGRTAGA